MIGCENSVNPMQSQTQNDNEGMSLAKKGPEKCATIQGGTILYSTGHFFGGQPITTGFDDFGYNYNGHMFKGSYYNSYAGGADFPPWMGDDVAYLDANPGAAAHWAWPYREVNLIMKWNDAWISNTDCDGDGSLDRHWGFPGYDNSGAWLTNHQSGDNWCGGSAPWTYYTKIVTPSTLNGDWKDDNGTVPTGDDVWYDANNVEIGPAIWGAFATVLQISNDECIEGEHGVYYKSPKAPGFGLYSSFE